MSEIAQHYELIDDDPDFGLAKGDVLACIPYDMDKLTVVFRVSDHFDPSCNVYREQVRKVDGQTPIRWRDAPPYGAEPNPAATQPPVIGDDAEAAIAAQAEAERDLTAWLVTTMAARSSGDPEDTYQQYFEQLAETAGIDLDAAFAEATGKEFLDGIDRPGEEVRREPQISQENVEAISASIVGGPEPWGRLDRAQRFVVLEQVVKVLNTAKATGWTAPSETTVAEIERLRGRMNHFQDLLRDALQDAERLQEWSNELAARVPEEYEASEGTQEGCIDAWLGDVDKLLTEVEPLVGEAGAFQQVVHPGEGVLPIATATIEMADLERLRYLVARLTGGDHDG